MTERAPWVSDRPERDLRPLFTPTMRDGVNVSDQPMVVRAGQQSEGMGEMDATATSVVVGVDGTEGSLGALRYAAQQAQRRGCSLVVVHVGLRYDPTYSVFPQVPHHIDVAGRAILDQATGEVAGWAPEVEVTTMLRKGSRIAELVDSAVLGGLIVLGRESHRGLERFVFGATTAAVVARTSVPASVVPGDWEPSPPTGPVVVGLRTSAHSETLFEAAFEFAAAGGVGVEAIHAWKAPDPYIDRLDERSRGRELVEAGTEFLEGEVAPWRDRYPGVPVTVRAVHEWPSEVIVSAGETASLIVLLRQPAPRVLGAHLGSTARSIISAARCPVHVMPAPRADSEPFGPGG